MYYKEPDITKKDPRLQITKGTEVHVTVTGLTINDKRIFTSPLKLKRYLKLVKNFPKDNIVQIETKKING